LGQSTALVLTTKITATRRNYAKKPQSTKRPETNANGSKMAGVKIQTAQKQKPE